MSFAARGVALLQERYAASGKYRNPITSEQHR